MKTIVWIIGEGGMLGQAIARAVQRGADTIGFESTKLAWADPDLLMHQVAASSREIIEASTAHKARWCVIWAAGAAVTSATDEEVAIELGIFRSSIATIATAAAGHESQGSLFVASSAGAVYGAALDPPFTEHTAPAARSPYGRLKLEQEASVAELADRGIAVLVGRITNLYGPGQSLAKMQGLVSHSTLAHLGGKPVSIFVPLETLRDYIYVDDCASLVLASLDRLALEADGRGLLVTKIMGSGHGLSISSLLGYAQAIGKKRPHAMVGTSPHAAHQALDLRMHSIVWPDLDRFDKTPLPAGFQSTIHGVLASIQDGPVK